MSSAASSHTLESAASAIVSALAGIKQILAAIAPDVQRRLLQCLSESDNKVENAEPGRYTKPDSIWAALESESVKLVRMTYVIELAEADGVLPRRQDIDDAAFVGVQELKSLYGTGGSST